MDRAETVSGIIDRILEVERWPAFTDDPDDRGGPTKGGITAATLGKWRGLKRPATTKEVSELSEQEARAIYYHEFVFPFVWGVDLWDGVLLGLLTDMAVLHGAPNTRKLLQRAVGVFPDGVLGPKSMAAIRRTSPRSIFAALLSKRLEFIATDVVAHPRQLKYLKGWLRRCGSFIPSLPSCSSSWPVVS